MKLNIQLFGGRGASSSSSRGYGISYWRKRGTKVGNKVPKGWVKVKNATTAPRGYSWYSNNKSLFSGERKTMLVKN